MNRYLDDTVTAMANICTKLDLLEVEITDLKRAVTLTSQHFRYRGCSRYGYQVSHQFRLNVLKDELDRREIEFIRLMHLLQYSYDRYMMLIR